MIPPGSWRNGMKFQDMALGKMGSSVHAFLDLLYSPVPCGVPRGRDLVSDWDSSTGRQPDRPEVADMDRSATDGLISAIDALMRMPSSDERASKVPEDCWMV